MGISSETMPFCHCERSEAIHCCRTNGLLRRVAARNDGLDLGRDFRQRRVERRVRARQILEGANMPRLLKVLFRNTRTNLRERLAALDHFSRRADMKLMVLDRSVLQQPDAQGDDVVAAPVRDIAIDRDGPVSLMSAELCVTLGIQKLVRSKSLHISRFCF